MCRVLLKKAKTKQTKRKQGPLRNKIKANKEQGGILHTWDNWGEMRQKPDSEMLRNWNLLLLISKTQDIWEQSVRHMTRSCDLQDHWVKESISAILWPKAALIGLEDWPLLLKAMSRESIIWLLLTSHYFVLCYCMTEGKLVHICLFLMLFYQYNYYCCYLIPKILF